MIRMRHSRFLLVVGFASVVWSCGREAPTAPSAATPGLAPTFSVTAPAPTVVYGPATLTRDTGKPRTDTTSFGAEAGDTLTIVLTSGATQGMNATVDVNGSRIYAVTESRTLPDTIRVVAHAMNALRVWMAGKPGSSLRIVVTVPAPAVPAETRILTSIYGSGVSGAAPAGDLEVPLDSPVHYGFAANPGFERLTVVVDGQLAPPTGTLAMDRAHWISASADTVITLDATEQALGQLLRGMLTSATPLEAWTAYQTAAGQAVTAWGVEASVHLARVRYATIDPESDLANMVRLDSALAGVETPIEWPSATTSLREGSAQTATRIALRQQQATTEAPAGSREATHIILVNGILTGADELRDVADLLKERLLSVPDRFPPGTVTMSHLHNPSLFKADADGRVAIICTNATTDSRRVFDPLNLALMASIARMVGCLATGRIVSPNMDLLEMRRWLYGALTNNRQIASETDHLTRKVRSFAQDARRHVIVVGHSEGSLMMQLAIQRLTDLYDFHEESAPQCVGTVSIGGVGTANWPLSARHSRFVVAKNDLVTLLPAPYKNTRKPVEDEMTRRLDAQLLIFSDTAYGPWVSVAREATKWLGSVEIHRIGHYLSSPEIWPVISQSLDELYRTCAVGAVTVSPPAVTVQLLGAAPFGATWNALDGQPLNTTDSVHWSVDAASASVTPDGRVLAGSTPGVATLQARVRNTLGAASITVVDDSVRALYTAPVVTVTERTITDYQPVPWLPNLPPVPHCASARAATISASAMPGASIASVVLYTRSVAAPFEYFSFNAPLDVEFVYLTRDCALPSGPIPDYTDFSWYRLEVTDSHGLVTKVTRPTP